jgi:hypothetical protein
VVSGFGGDDELVAVRFEVVSQVPAEIGFGAAAGWAVVVGEIKMRDAEIERAAKAGPLRLESFVAPKLCQKPSETAGSFSPLRPILRYGIES